MAHIDQSSQLKKFYLSPRLEFSRLKHMQKSLLNFLGKKSTNIFSIYRSRVLEDQQEKITDVSIDGRSEIPSITKSLKTLQRTMNKKIRKEREPANIY
jgi:hypothetical protein